MNIHDEAHEIGRSGGVRNIADYTRLRPGDDIVFRLSHRVCDEANVRFDLAGPPGRGDTVPQRRVDQHHVSLQGRAQRHHLPKISAQPDHRDRRIAFKELGENFAAETHFGDDHDAQTPRFGGKQAQLARREVGVLGKCFPSITAKVQPWLVHVSRLLFGPCSTRRRRPPTSQTLSFREHCAKRSLAMQDCLGYFWGCGGGWVPTGPGAEMWKTSLEDRCMLWRMAGRGSLVTRGRIGCAATSDPRLS